MTSTLTRPAPTRPRATVSAEPRNVLKRLLDEAEASVRATEPARRTVESPRPAPRGEAVPFAWD
jgi:hypothetical protein